MLSSRLVLPERYGPHSATTRCAPLPGLPPVMVSDLMSFMTTSSLPRSRLRLKAPDGGRYGSRPERSLVPEIVSPWPGGVNAPAGGVFFAGAGVLQKTECLGIVAGYAGAARSAECRPQPLA